MRNRSVHVILLAVLAFTTATGLARADVCIGIDESRDTLSEPDRTASLILLGKQFELAGEHVAPEGCTATYTVSHVKFGDTITGTLAGPGGHINFMDDAEVAANVSWQNYERSWHLWKVRALAKLEAERRQSTV